MNDRRSGISDDLLLFEAGIAGLRAAHARAASVRLDEPLVALRNQTDALEQQLRAAIIEPGSGFTTRHLRRLVKRFYLEAILARIDTDLPALLERILVQLPNDTELSPPDRSDWSKALAVVTSLRILNDCTVANPRGDNVRAALERLTLLGHKFKLVGSGIDPDSDGFRTVTERVIAHLTKVGRFHTFRNLEASARATHGYEFDQVLYGRNSSNSPRNASVPFGFLWQLAARLPDLSPCADPAVEWRSALDLARDVVALVDVETYGQFWMIGGAGDQLVEMLANATLHDHLFSVQQWSLYITPLLLRACLKIRKGDSCFAANMIHTLDVDTQAAGPDGQDRPKDQALPV